MPHTKAAFDQMDLLTPKFKGLGIDSLLYVGWRHDCHSWWHRKFAPALGVKRVGIIEIFPPNVSDAEQRIWGEQFTLPTEVFQGDILEPEKHFKSSEYDAIFWDHGPEHVSLAQLQVVTPILQRMANKLLIYCCPWGSWPQGVTDGNEHEKHLWDVQVEDLTNMGLVVMSTGLSGQQREGELIAWRSN